MSTRKHLSDPLDWRSGDPIPEPSPTQRRAKSEEEMSDDDHWIPMGPATVTDLNGNIRYGRLFIKRRDTADGE